MAVQEIIKTPYGSCLNRCSDRMTLLAIPPLPSPPSHCLYLNHCTLDRSHSAACLWQRQLSSGVDADRPPLKGRIPGPEPNSSAGRVKECPCWVSAHTFAVIPPQRRCPHALASMLEANGRRGTLKLPAMFILAVSTHT